MRGLEAVIKVEKVDDYYMVTFEEQFISERLTEAQLTALRVEQAQMKTDFEAIKTSLGSLETTEYLIVGDFKKSRAQTAHELQSRIDTYTESLKLIDEA